MKEDSEQDKKRIKSTSKENGNKNEQDKPKYKGIPMETTSSTYS